MARRKSGVIPRIRAAQGTSDGRNFGERERVTEQVRRDYTKCKFCIIRRTIPTDLSGLRSVLSLKSPNPRPPSDLSHDSGTPRIPDISQLSTLNSDEARGQSLIRGLLIVYHALVISVISVASISFSTVMNPLTRSGGLLAVCCPYCYLQM